MQFNCAPGQRQLSHLPAMIIDHSWWGLTWNWPNLTINVFSFENVYFLMRLLLSFTQIRPKTPTNTEYFENGFKGGDFWKRWLKKTVCIDHGRQSFWSFSIIYIVWKGEDDKKTPVWIKILYFVFAEIKTGTFENLSCVDGPQSRAVGWRGLVLSFLFSALLDMSK